MHEVALSEQLAQVVRRAACGRKVVSVHLKIGALRQVIPETLTYAWIFTTANTALEHARLEIEWVPGQLRCPEGHESLMQGEFDVHCPVCGTVSRIIGGEEFTVVDIEVAAREEAAPGQCAGHPDEEGQQHGSFPPP
ncbi:hydrogenase maturation nickel metallochaperone HypA [Corynebacterium poyangense]|uniref:Hydrogenase maturation factor HypA n=1 Tax=Corynebacterium poyangense TaxID=2684405 RepID=A0A7H0SR54_9CORY|nr:hydrogenase maturation nickel metallochaperone HypA [Corynebacterium poyangense]MBZ8176456.1 hydrogenase maturation nickel metallochaperone HypA [Corynebacterium poyangense]QNQ91029.1 hydrogenase maturation nickel metallochaperone HypA [Corynebacterium poyangense]